MHFKLVKGNAGLIATLKIKGDVTREECERLFRERCSADSLEIDGQVFTLVQSSLIGYPVDEAECAAYVTAMCDYGGKHSLAQCECDPTDLGEPQ